MNRKETRNAEPILTWRVCLLREQPAKMLLVAPIVFAGIVVSIILFRSLIFTAVTFFLFLSSLAEYIFPISYEIDKEGASSKALIGKTRIEWKNVKKYYIDEHGIKLSPLKKQSRLEAYRGVYLRFGNRRDEVIRIVRMMRDEHCNGVDS